MPYKVAITPRIQAKLEGILGKGADLSKISVFEARSNDTRMIARTGGIMKNSRMDESYLQGMAANVSNGGYVPLASHHNTYNHAEGRIFDGAVYTAPDGAKELHTLFYVNANQDPQSIDQRLSSGIINSVSTNTLPSAILCSNCGFNYLKDQSSREMLFSGKDYSTPECPNGHVSGKDGNHLVLSGTPKTWREQSLVMNGAVEGASILDTTAQKLSAESTSYGLAASADDDKLAVITNAFDSEPTNPTPKGKTMTDISVPLAEHNKGVIAIARVSEVEAQLAAANTAKDNAIAAQLAAETAKTEAEAAKLAAETAKTEAETAKAASDAEVVRLTAQIATLGGAPAPKTEGAGNETQPAGRFVNPAQFKRAAK